jgi:hypothetical protein
VARLRVKVELAEAISAIALKEHAQLRDRTGVQAISDAPLPVRMRSR